MNKEKWDIYNKDFTKTKKKVFRGDKLGDDEYHMVINAWIVNDKNQFLITQRVATKPHGLMWECTGGSALAGESDIDACVREIKEELNIDIDVTTAKFLGMTTRYYKNCPDILRVYIFKDNTPLKNVAIQQEEVAAAQWATKKTILRLIEEGKFEANAFIMDALNFRTK